MGEGSTVGSWDKVHLSSMGIFQLDQVWAQVQSHP